MGGRETTNLCYESQKAACRFGLSEQFFCRFLARQCSQGFPVLARPTSIPPSVFKRAEPSGGADRSRSIAYSGLSGAILRPMKVEEIAEAIAKLPPDQLARFRRWFTAFDAGRTDHAQELDSTATKLGRLAGRAFAELKRRAQE